MTDPAWYQALTGQLTDEQTKGLQEVFLLADQRKAAAESRRIEQSGGELHFQHPCQLLIIPKSPNNFLLTCSPFLCFEGCIFLTTAFIAFTGYVFNQQTVPTSFNFGGSPLGQ